ncbi:sensor histidine kinase [Chitinophaga sp. RAB17]|uniref:sensor histidine kinase n=1 Tax=Chitinophaga sp. RAB17 TaxID=3233049 RepID=UPI003F93D95A
MKKKSTTLTASWDAPAGRWLLTAFITEKRWPHILFHLGIFTAGFLAILFYTGSPRGGQAFFWYMTIYQFIMCAYVGRRMCNNHLLRGQPLLFSFSFLLSVFVLMTTYGITLNYAYDISFHDSLLLTILAVAPFPLISICLGIALKLLRHTIRQQYATAEQRKSELDLLLSQLSPHFLFNTLNNLYGLSLTQSQRMPELILKLSDLLRYSVYDAKQTFVPLKSELAYIDNYIELATTSIGERLILTTDIATVNDPAIRIAPMLLIVFIENAFKHSQNSAAANIYIDIRLAISGERIHFTVSNSYDEKESDTIREEGGIGIANSIKRLQLLYDNTYDYRYEKKEGFYTATLTLQLK